MRVLFLVLSCVLSLCAQAQSQYQVKQLSHTFYKDGEKETMVEPSNWKVNVYGDSLYTITTETNYTHHYPISLEATRMYSCTIKEYKFLDPSQSKVYKTLVVYYMNNEVIGLYVIGHDETVLRLLSDARPI